MEEETFTVGRVSSIDRVLAKIRECEGKHRQQVVFSTHHHALTQICFDCKRVRTNLGN